MNDNLLVDRWNRLKIALLYSIEALFNILRNSNEAIRKSPISLDKYFERLYFCSRKQISCLVTTKKLIVSIPKEKRQAVSILLRFIHNQRHS